jgi:hypothetical protein
VPPTAPLVEQTRRVKGGRVCGFCLSDALEECGLTFVATGIRLFVQCNAAILRDTHTEEPSSRNGNRRQSDKPRTARTKSTGALSKRRRRLNLNPAVGVSRR